MPSQWTPCIKRASLIPAHCGKKGASTIPATINKWPPKAPAPSPTVPHEGVFHPFSLLVVGGGTFCIQWHLPGHSVAWQYVSGDSDSGKMEQFYCNNPDFKCPKNISKNVSRSIILLVKVPHCVQPVISNHLHWKILSAIRRQTDNIRPASFILWQCLRASFPPLTSSGLRSLSEALLDGHLGEEAGELLDNPHVYLRAEGDVQEEKSWTGLEEFLQWGSAHQTGTWTLDEKMQDEDINRGVRI